MHHLLMYAPAPWISFLRAQRKILIPEFAPHPKHLDSLRAIALDKKFVSHSRKWYASVL